jgi:hypothetical protein
MSRSNSKPAPEPGQEDAPKAPAPEFVADEKVTGRVTFDERDNAVWEWSIATGKYGAEVSRERMKKLEHPTLSLADDAPTPVNTVRPNPLGKKKGYDPYDSGKLGKAPATRKKDLRKLGEWLKLRKQASVRKDED